MRRGSLILLARATTTSKAIQERVKLATDKLRQASASGRVSLSEEAEGMPLQQAGWCGLRGAVALIVDRGPIAMRPAALASVDLHAMGTGSLAWCNFSGRARQRSCHWGDMRTQRHSGDHPTHSNLVQERHRRPHLLKLGSRKP